MIFKAEKAKTGSPWMWSETGIWTQILQGSTRGSWFDAPSQSCSKYLLPDRPLQTARCIGKTFDRQKGNITMSCKPSLHLQGLGQERKGKHTVSMCYLVLPGCRDQMHLAILKSTQGVSGKQDSLSAAAMAEMLQSHQDMPLLCPGLGATGIKETSLLGS